MRPTLILGLAAALAAFGTAALADSNPPAPTVSIAGGVISVQANGNTHLNNHFTWSVKNTNKSGKQFNVAGISFPFDPNASTGPTAIASTSTGSPTLPNPSWVRGGFCQDTGCFTFWASCGTSGACSVTTP